MSDTRRTRYWPTTLPEIDRAAITLVLCPACERCAACGGWSPDKAECARCDACPFCDGEHYVTARRRGEWRDPITLLPPSSIPADLPTFRKQEP